MKKALKTLLDIFINAINIFINVLDKFLSLPYFEYDKSEKKWIVQTSFAIVFAIVLARIGFYIIRFINYKGS